MTKTTLQQVTDHVWIYPADPKPQNVQPLIGIVCTQSQTVLVDAGNCPARARRILAALHEISAPEVSHVIYTHHHWDHIFGAQVYNAPVVAHETCKQMTVNYAQAPWSPQYLRQEAKQTPRRKVSMDRVGQVMEGDWDTFAIVLPSIVFEDQKLCLPLDGVTVEVEHVGGHHSADSTVVTVLDDGVMFMGDCFYPPPSHLNKDNLSYDEDMLVGFLERKLNFYADGHSGAFTAADWHKMLGLD
jgi:glyoxylase-like metal-dependent hydrolase (beta-lactamase superfamily II)